MKGKVQYHLSQHCPVMIRLQTLHVKKIGYNYFIVTIIKFKCHHTKVNFKTVQSKHQYR